MRALSFAVTLLTLLIRLAPAHGEKLLPLTKHQTSASLIALDELAKQGLTPSFRKLNTNFKRGIQNGHPAERRNRRPRQLYGLENEKLVDGTGSQTSNVLPSKTSSSPFSNTSTVQLASRSMSQSESASASSQSSAQGQNAMSSSASLLGFNSGTFSTSSSSPQANATSVSAPISLAAGIAYTIDVEIGSGSSSVPLIVSGVPHHGVR